MIIDLAERRIAFERLAISVAGLLELRNLTDPGPADIAALADVVHGHGPLVREALYQGALNSRTHKEAAVWAFALLGRIKGWREALS